MAKTPDLDFAEHDCGIGIAVRSGMSEHNLDLLIVLPNSHLSMLATSLGRTVRFYSH